MLVLVNKYPGTLEKYRHPNLGLFMGPRNNYNPDRVDGWVWGADNDCFNGGLDEPAYRAMLDRIDGIPGGLFVVAPDVVADAAATLDLLYDWLGDLRGFPVALVAQDGLQLNCVPWLEIDALFIGGSTGYKMSRDAATAVAEAKRQGKWVHMGRVNTRRRFRYAKSIGCDSVDGTSASKWTDAHLGWQLTHAGAAPQLGWHV